MIRECRDAEGPAAFVNVPTTYKARVVYLEPPIPLIRARNAGRTRYVPRRVWDRMLDNLDVPNRSEAHQVD